MRGNAHNLTSHGASQLRMARGTPSLLAIQALRSSIPKRHLKFGEASAPTMTQNGAVKRCCLRGRRMCKAFGTSWDRSQTPPRRWSRHQSSQAYQEKTFVMKALPPLPHMESRVEDSSHHGVCLAAVLSLHFHSLAGGGPARLPEGRIEGAHHVDPGQRQPREEFGHHFEDAHLRQGNLSKGLFKGDPGHAGRRKHLLLHLPRLPRTCRALETRRLTSTRPRITTGPLKM